MHITVHWHIGCIMSNYVRDGAIALKGGLSLNGGQADFSKKPPDTSFNKDLSNEPTFGRIHLAGQYL